MSEQSGAWVEINRYALLGWGEIYSFGTGAYVFLPEAFFQVGGTMLTNVGIMEFLILPVATAGAGLLEPEILGRSRYARIGYGASGLLMLSIAVNCFQLAGIGIGSGLLGTSIAVVGFAVILFPLYKWTASPPPITRHHTGSQS